MNGFEFCRKRAGLKQTEVADALGVKQAAVCQWETGRSYPIGERVIALSKLYGCEISDLYAGAGENVSRKALEALEMREFARKYGLKE